MALNPRFLISPNIQENFISKDTGLPMAGGSLRFFRDSSRQEPKSVYVLTGAPPNYEYLNIGNEVTLNSAGAASYDFGSGATDVKLYYNPFDSDGILDNYFLEARDSNGVLQFTREAWPDFKGSDSSDDAEDVAFSNFIPNGQFLSRNNVRNNGRISQAVTNIALGNWTFERPENSTAIDDLTFQRFEGYVALPESNPRHYVRLINTGGGSGEILKDLRVKFDDVNKFNSESSDPEYTFKFDAKSNAGNFNVQVYLIKNFGDEPGASVQEETLLDTFELNTSYQSFVTSFNFGNNINKTISDNDSDFLQIAVRFPVGSLLSGDLTNFALVKGVFSGIAFPDTTTRQSVSQSLGGAFPVPDPDGYDIYLKPRLTSTGWEFDRTEIGKVLTSSTPNLEVGELLADGAAYIPSDYSTDGIPYQRLFDKYWDSDTMTPIYGTGDDYVTAYSVGGMSSATQLTFTNNTNGNATPVADGAVPTGFLISQIHTAINEAGMMDEGYGVNAWVTSSGKGWIQNKEAGTLVYEATAITAVNEPSINPSAGTSGMGVGNIYLLEGTIYQQVIGTNGATGNSIFRSAIGLGAAQEFNIDFLPASQLANPGVVGKYFTYRTIHQRYCVWYSTGSETQPNLNNPGHYTYVYLSVMLETDDSAQTVAEKTIFALNNFQCSLIKSRAGSAITAGSYITASTPTTDFYYWFRVDAVGNDPNVPNTTGVMVDVLSTDTPTKVTQKIVKAINSYQYAVPDYRGLSIKGLMGDRADIGLDDDLPYRFNRNNVKFGGNQISSEQLSLNRQHYHKGVRQTVSQPGSAHRHVVENVDGEVVVFDNFGINSYALNDTDLLVTKEEYDSIEAGSTSRPANSSINYVIKY